MSQDHANFHLFQLPVPRRCCHTGWLRLVGSIKSQVSFVESSLFYRALLQKRPVISSILLPEATPYIYHRKLQQRSDVSACNALSAEH